MPKTHYEMMPIDDYDPEKPIDELTPEEQTLRAWAERLDKVHGELSIRELVLYTYTDKTSSKHISLENLLDECSKTRPLTKVEDKIPFGKYKGKTFQDVYSVNPQYVKWLLNNCDTINFDTVSFNSLFHFPGFQD